jgi:hypothetical protein
LKRRALLLTLALPATAAADEAALVAQMAALAAVRQRRSRFTEERAIPELDVPLPNSGTLFWQAPDRLEKHTLSPFEERLTVSGPRLTYERPDRGIRRDFSLSEQPEMQALVEAVRSTLAGDLATLRRHYEVGFEAWPGDAWRLVLTPLALRVRGAVQRIVVTGTGDAVTGVDTEGGGGVTRMRITS